MTAHSGREIWMHVIALIAVAFGLLTIREGGAVLFVDGAARAAAGSYVPFVLWFNSSPEPQRISLPENDWVARGEVVLSTDPAHALGAEVRAGEQITLAARSLLLLRQL